MTNPNRTLAVVAPRAYWTAGESTQQLQDDLDAELQEHGIQTKLYNSHNGNPRQIKLREEMSSATGLLVANYSEIFGAVDLDEPVKEAAKVVVPAELPIFVMSAVGLTDLGLEGPAELITFGADDGYDISVVVKRLVPVDYKENIGVAA